MGDFGVQIIKNGVLLLDHCIGFPNSVFDIYYDRLKMEFFPTGDYSKVTITSIILEYWTYLQCNIW